MKITYKLLLPHIQGLSGENKTNLALVCLQGGGILNFFFKGFCFCMLLVLSGRGWGLKIHEFAVRDHVIGTSAFKNFTRYLKIYTQTPVITDWPVQDNLVVLSKNCFFFLNQNYSILRTSLYCDMTLRHWVIGSGRFEGT